MNPFEQIRRGLFDTWESVAAGWHELWQRAGTALTRFHPAPKGGDDPEKAQLKRDSSPWSLLAAEVAEGDTEIDVRIEIPGMEAKDFEIDVVGDHLVVRGEKRIEREAAHGEYTLLERAYGRFERRVRLPADVDDKAAKATYRRGVLHVRLPKVSGAARKTKIEVAGSEESPRAGDGA